MILNPFDPRAHTWNIYGELTAAHDVEQLARSLIPDQEGSDQQLARLRAHVLHRPRDDRRTKPASGT